jgi:hypothetical protein
VKNKNKNLGNDYEVGYGKPPKETRFKPGESGNPKGRPKGKENTHTIIQRALDQPVIINENGKRRVVSKKEAAILVHVNKAATGQTKDLKTFFYLVRCADEMAEKSRRPVSELSDEELEQILRETAHEEEEVEEEEEE